MQFAPRPEGKFQSDERTKNKKINKHEAENEKNCCGMTLVPLNSAPAEFNAGARPKKLQ